mgnify:CR=1 FL=1
MKNLILTCIVSICSIIICEADTIYVTQTGAGSLNGSSWANAASGTNLQNIIDSANSGDEIWVACGTYTPSLVGNRAISYSMRNNVAIYGGFQGTETSLPERNFSCGSCSILSGEIGIPGDNTDNTFTIIENVDLNDTAILDGFVISDANDDRSITNSGQGLGGGMHNNGLGATGLCSPTIRNCIFSNNSAGFGGGAFNNGYNGGNSEPNYINCVFYQNHATIAAGGMDSYGVNGNASPTLVNTLFYENTSDNNVGAMYAWGGNANGNSHPTLINCAFINNHANNGYAGAFIADNRDTTGGAASGSSSVTLQNCIVWGNTSTTIAPQFFVNGTADVFATYSDIDLTGQTVPHIISGSGTGNITQNPQFININNPQGGDSCWFTSDDGLQFQSSSPCIDAGINNNIYSTDIAGNDRISNSQVDIGLYEFNEALNVNQFSQSVAVIVAPNPFNNYINLYNILEEDLIVLYNTLGQQIECRSIYNQNTMQKTLYIENVKSGVYFIKTKRKIIRIIKQ